MTYVSSPGRQATKVGINCRNSATAERRAMATCAYCDAPRMGSRSATLSSLSSRRAASLRNAFARLGVVVARYAVTNTLISTSSALGGGNSSPTATLCANASISCTPSNTRPGYHRPSTTGAGQALSEVNAGYRGHDTVWLRCGKALAFLEGCVVGLVMPGSFGSSRDHAPSFSGVRHRRGEG